jgi:hypothetical protein
MKSAAPDFAAAAMSPEEYGTFGADHRFTGVEDTLDHGLRYLLACWYEMRGERDMPERADVTPRSLGPSLRFVQMYEIVEGGRDFRCRVFGTGLAESTGLQVTGRRVSELEDARVRERMVGAMRRVVQTQGPVRMTGDRAAMPHLAHRQVETIWLPLGGREGVTHILSGCVFPSRPANAA